MVSGVYVFQRWTWFCLIVGSGVRPNTTISKTRNIWTVRRGQFERAQCVLQKLFQPGDHKSVSYIIQQPETHVWNICIWYEHDCAHFLDPVFDPPRLSAQPERIEQWDMDRLNKHNVFSKNIFIPQNYDNQQISIISYSTTWESWLDWVQCSAHRDYLHNQKELNSETWLFERTQCVLQKISSASE